MIRVVSPPPASPPPRPRQFWGLQAVHASTLAAVLIGGSELHFSGHNDNRCYGHPTIRCLLVCVNVVSVSGEPLFAVSIFASSHFAVGIHAFASTSYRRIMTR